MEGHRMSPTLLTQLGQALGCSAKAASDAAGGEAKVDGFPARCWYSGPLEVVVDQREPRPPKIQIEAPTHMDREARELAQRGQRDIVRFAQMMARARKPK
jgi:hypothetical protein